jgi:hypothetical protein
MADSFSTDIKTVYLWETSKQLAEELDLIIDCRPPSFGISKGEELLTFSDSLIEIKAFLKGYREARQQRTI